MRTRALGAAAAIIASLERPPLPGAWGAEALEAQRTLDILEELATAEDAMPGGLGLEERARTLA